MKTNVRFKVVKIGSWFAVREFIPAQLGKRCSWVTLGGYHRTQADAESAMQSATDAELLKP